MAAVHITGWRPGFKKVSHAQTLQALGGMSPPEARAATDAVLDGKPVTVAVETFPDAAALAARLEELGAQAEARND